MLPYGLLVAATFLGEAGSSIGKRSVRQRLESVVALGFLQVFWSALIMIGTVVFLHARWHFDKGSLPFLGTRLFFEMFVYYFTVHALVKADRSTFAFLRLITVPLLLVVDILVGYHVTPEQTLGVLIVFGAICIVFSGRKLSRKGSASVLLGALGSVITVSLYKYDITHYNSVATEQTIVYSFLIGFFMVLGWMRGESMLRYLRRPWAEAQSLANGAGSVLTSVAYNHLPASVVSAGLRGLSVLWAIVFGNVYFHERHLIYKLLAFGLVIAGLGITLIHT